MADLNARIIAKASGTASEEPLASDLEVAELAVNTADGKLFTKHTDGSIVTISGGGTSATAVAPSAGVNVPDQSDISLALNMSAYSGSSVVSVDSYATTWNLVGNATFTTSWARFPGGALDTTSGGYIEPDLGTTLSEQFDGDFTIAFWINKASNNYGPVFDFRHNDSIFCWVETTGSLTVGVGSSGNNISSSVLSNGDHHIAIVRDGITIRLYVDGALDGSLVVDPVENVFFIDTSYKTIGAYFTGAQYYFDGYIADFVIANGHAVWSAAFTPPTSNVDYFQDTGALPLPNGAVGDLAYNSQNGDYYYATSGSSWDKVVAHSSTLTPSNGEAIVWNATSGAWEFGSSQGLLGDLPDVDTSTNPPTDGQVLTWDNAAGQWEPATPASALVSSVNGQTGAVDLALSDINDVYTGTTDNGHLMDSKQSVTSSSWTTPYDGKFYRAANDAAFRFAKTDANGTDFESQITSLAAGDYFEIEYSSGYIASFTLTGAAVTVDLNNYYVILVAPSADELTALSNSNSVLIRSNKFSYNGLSNGQVLTYDSTQGRWEAADPLLSETATTWTVTASGNNHYVFSGDGFAGTETDPVLYVVRGQTYKISNTMNAHPFQIQRTSGTSGVVYSDGITNNGVINGTLEWEVRLDAPSTLYYQCTQHAAMGGTIQVLENPSNAAIDDLGDVGDVLDYNEFSSIGSWNSEIVAIDTGGNDFPDAQGEWSIYESTTAGTSYLMVNKTTSAGADYTSLFDLVVANPTDYSFKIKVNGGDQSSVVAITAAVLQTDDRYRFSFSTADLDPANYNEGGYSSSNSSTGGNGPYSNVLELDIRLSSLYTVVADGSVLTWNATNEYWEPAAPSGGGGGATAIDDLTDVDTSTVAPTDGQALIWDNAAGKWEPGTVSGGSATTIDDLTDVDTSTVAPTDGQVLTWDNVAAKWEPGTVTGGGATAIDDLTDVDTATTAPTDGQVLTWVDANSQWEPADPSDAVDSVNGQTGVVSLAADNLTDVATQIDSSFTSSFETAADYVSGYITTNNPRTGSYSAEKLTTSYGLRAAVANAYPDLSKRYDVTRIYVNLNGNANNINNRIILGGTKWEGSSGAITGTHHGYSLYLNNAFHVLDSSGTLISVGTATALPTSSWVEVVSVFDWQNGRTSSPNLSIWIDGNLEVSNVTMTGTYTQKGNDEDKYWASGYWAAGSNNHTAYVDDLLTFQQDTLSWGMTDATIGDISQYAVLSPTDGQVLAWVDANSRWEPSDYISKATLKTEVAAATDFADFQSRIAAL